MGLPSIGKFADSKSTRSSPRGCTFFNIHTCERAALLILKVKPSLFLSLEMERMLSFCRYDVNEVIIASVCFLVGILPTMHKVKKIVKMYGNVAWTVSFFCGEFILLFWGVPISDDLWGGDGLTAE